MIRDVLYQKGTNGGGVYFTGVFTNSPTMSSISPTMTKGTSSGQSCALMGYINSVGSLLYYSGYSSTNSAPGDDGQFLLRNNNGIVVASKTSTNYMSLLSFSANLVYTSTLSLDIYLKLSGMDQFTNINQVSITSTDSSTSGTLIMGSWNSQISGGQSLTALFVSSDSLRSHIFVIATLSSSNVFTPFTMDVDNNNYVLIVSGTSTNPSGNAAQVGYSNTNGYPFMLPSTTFSGQIVSLVFSYSVVSSGTTPGIDFRLQSTLSITDPAVTMESMTNAQNGNFTFISLKSNTVYTNEVMICSQCSLGYSKPAYSMWLCL
jgi:hypothetical protein